MSAAHAPAVGDEEAGLLQEEEDEAAARDAAAGRKRSRKAGSQRLAVEDEDDEQEGGLWAWRQGDSRFSAGLGAAAALSFRFTECLLTLPINVDSACNPSRHCRAA